ncbi:RNA methyltransferase [Leptolyngbya cf. ectocarpi LEGE 11479]|uniref:RNA methyltransferase n=1 Tax=Leptolyngbya cf. ectocarpi LEGE 11479 TaxID=1828722 RepID=A0A928ZUK2_LEPEC|nr:RNA methyltransferase [Leptolyngbya ectocarpi]MBE9067737.1 RNA methyltransferase [Leptolyngbya cf. ectocarpi LEGE 11479]
MLEEPVVITSTKNPIAKQFRKLHQAKERRRQNVFLLEGTHLLQEACAVGHPLVQVAATEAWCRAHAEILDQLQHLTPDIRVVSPEVLSSMCTTISPDGVVAMAQRLVLSTGSDTVSLGVALERLQDPGNLGSVIRTAAAVGCDRIWLTNDSVDIDHPKVLRATAGQWFRLPMQTIPSLASLATLDGQLVATVPTASLDYWDLDLRQPTVFLMGNEGAGLSEQAMDLATHRVKIPLAPDVESLNVAIATAVLLYEAKRQRHGC